MEIGESVYCVSAIPNTPAILAVGCESGKLCVNDIETNKSLYSADNKDSIIVLRPIDDHIIFAASEQEIIRHDIRSPSHKAEVVFNSPSEISDIAINGDLFAIATYCNDIILSDKRLLRKPKATSGILPSVCNSLCFLDSKRIVTGYLDTSIGVWDLATTKFNPFTTRAATQQSQPYLTTNSKNPQNLSQKQKQQQQQQQVKQFNPSVVHGVASKGNIVAAATQNGLALYSASNGRLIVESLFEHEAAVQVIAFAECFNEENGFSTGNGANLFTVSGGADGSLMVFDCLKMKSYDCLTVEPEKIQCITSNSKVIAVADTSDNGNIGIFRPEDFSNAENDGEEEEEENVETKVGQ